MSHLHHGEGDALTSPRVNLLPLPLPRANVSKPCPAGLEEPPLFLMASWWWSSGLRRSGMCVRLAVITGARGSEQEGDRHRVRQVGAVGHQKASRQRRRKGVCMQFGVCWSQALRPWPALSVEFFLAPGLDEGGVLGPRG